MDHADAAEFDTSALHDPTVELSPQERGRLERIAVVQRELDQMDAAAASTPLPRRSTRRVSGQSVVFSLRLDPAEVETLEARAHLLGIKPSVLARNLVRIGLSAGAEGELARAVDELETAVSQVRSLVP